MRSIFKGLDFVLVSDWTDSGFLIPDSEEMFLKMVQNSWKSTKTIIERYLDEKRCCCLMKTLDSSVA